jgi:hypothetical protein
MRISRTAKTVFIVLMLLAVGAISAGEIPPSTLPSQNIIHLADLHPAIHQGLNLYCQGNVVQLSEGTARVADEDIHLRAKRIEIAPADVIEVSNLKMTLREGKMSP